MATRSTISVQHADGTISQTYCHWDGYISGIGVTLVDHYDTQEKAEELLKMGQISSLGLNLEKCEFYHRDRNEDFVAPDKFTDIDDWIKNHRHEEFDYIMINGHWATYADEHEFRLVIDQLEDEVEVEENV